jgi:hypothetical protein
VGRRRLFTLLSTAVVTATGCGRHCGSDCDAERKPSLGERLHDRFDKPRDTPPPPPRRSDPSIFSNPAAPPGVIPPRDSSIPPTSVPTTPGTFDPGLPLQPPIRNNFRPEPVPSTIPSEPLPPHKSNKELLLPEPIPAPGSKPSQSNYDPLFPPAAKNTPESILQEPIVAGSRSDLPDGSILQPPTETSVPMQMPMPSGNDLPGAIPDKPAGSVSYEQVPGFANVASGRKPLPEGLKKLKEKGFITFAYLHAAGADVTATRDLVEKQGMKFRSIAVAPDTLKANSETFAELLRETDARPLYVADDDGVRAGSLWYVYFRTAESLDADQANLRATRLGLKDPTASEEQKRFWLAINNLLANR